MYVLGAVAIISSILSISIRQSPSCTFSIYGYMADDGQPCSYQTSNLSNIFFTKNLVFGARLWGPILIWPAAILAHVAVKSNSSKGGMIAHLFMVRILFDIN